MSNNPQETQTEAPLMTSILVADIQQVPMPVVSRPLALLTLADRVVDAALRWAPDAAVHEISIYPGPASPDGYDICITLSGVNEDTQNRLLKFSDGLVRGLCGGDASIVEWVPDDLDDVRFPVWAARQDDAHTDADVDDDDEEAGNGQE